MSRRPEDCRYHEVAARLRDAIAAGEYPRGGQLPTEEKLAERLGVHRVTVNRALSILRAEGLVYVHRGKGTFVTEIPPIRRNAVLRYSREARERSGGRGAFAAEITALGRAPRSDVTVSRAVPPSRRPGWRPSSGSATRTRAACGAPG